MLLVAAAIVVGLFCALLALLALVCEIAGDVVEHRAGMSDRQVAEDLYPRRGR